MRPMLLRRMKNPAARGPAARGPASRGPAATLIPALVLIALASTLIPPPAEAQYPGVNYFGKNRIQYREFDWRIYHSPHFDVYYYTAEEHLLQKAVSLAESAYDELSRRFDYQIQEPTPLIIYQTHSAFLQQNIIVHGVPEGAQAFASPIRFRMVLPLDLPDPELYALIKHELTHIFQYHILFRGRLGGALRGAPPQWFIEGGASYFADDETPADKKYMIDLVVNDNIPTVQIQGGGFLAYRFGHAVFDFIEERWGEEAVIDLIYEVRNTIGSRIGRAIERTFRMDVEDFDTEFRRWARQRYLPELVERGEPGDFGKPYRLEPGVRGQESSPTAAPSGDLLAAFTIDKQEVDISLFDTEKRRRIKVLTKGLDTQVQWISAQFFTRGRQMGGDIAFSPDGNYLAAFGRREAGFSLLIIDVLNGGLHKIVDMDVEQQLAPAWSPDGRYIAFAGNRSGHFDIFTLDVETLEVANLTNDEIYDGAPAFSPDGRWLAYTSVVGEHSQLFRLDLTDPSKRYQLTQGDYSSAEPAFSPDGKRIYFTSDRDGAVFNVYGLDLEKGEIRQYTDAVTGCSQPTVLPLPGGGERLVYTGYWRGRHSLYMRDVEEPLGDAEPVFFDPEPAVSAEVDRFEPPIEVTIDDEEIDPYKGRKFFVEGIQQLFGLDTNNIFVGRIIVSLSDFLGDRRAIGVIDAVDTLSNFDLRYFNLKNRWQWSARLFNQRVITAVIDRNEPDDPNDDRFETRTLFAFTGLEYTRTYPFNRSNRVEFTGGFYLRDFRFDDPARDILGNVDLVLQDRQDEYPGLRAAFISDTVLFNQWGPLNGHRVRVDAFYAPDIDESGTLEASLSFDARKYIALGRRTNLAFRLVGDVSEGDFPNPTFIGGLDTVRGFRFREFAGFRSFYGNAELRFPLIDELRFPAFSLQGIRGVIFFDVGSAWFPDSTDFDFIVDDPDDPDNDQLGTVVASFGFGFTLRLFGLGFNWDFAQVLDSSAIDQLEEIGFAPDTGSFETSFWIGTRF